jgi:hypothetical protein
MAEKGGMQLSRTLSFKLSSTAQQHPEGMALQPSLVQLVTALEVAFHYWCKHGSS